MPDLQRHQTPHPPTRPRKVKLQFRWPCEAYKAHVQFCSRPLHYLLHLIRKSRKLRGQLLKKRKGISPGGRSWWIAAASLCESWHISIHGTVDFERVGVGLKTMTTASPGNLRASFGILVYLNSRHSMPQTVEFCAFPVWSPMLCKLFRNMKNCFFASST